MVCHIIKFTQLFRLSFINLITLYAGTALSCARTGLPATARIAEGLCHYLERSRELGAPADAAVIALHVSAIGRATRDSDHGGQTSQIVTSELAALAARKLAEAGSCTAEALSAVNL